MMDMLNSLFDPYDRKARLAPALLCALPLFVSLLLLIPEVGALWGAVGGLVLYCGGAKFLTQVGRDRGKVQDRPCTRPGAGSLQWPCCAIPIRGSTRRRRTAIGHFCNVPCPAWRWRLPRKNEPIPRLLTTVTKAQTRGSWHRPETGSASGCCLPRTSTTDFGETCGPSSHGRSPWRRSPLPSLPSRPSTPGRESSPLPSPHSAPSLWASLVFIIVHASFFALKIRAAWVRLVADAYAHQLLAACDAIEIERQA